MVDTFKINGQVVSSEEFRAFRDFLTTLWPIDEFHGHWDFFDNTLRPRSESIVSAFEDNEVDWPEIVRILDTDDDGHLTPCDFKGIPLGCFKQLDSFLERYGINVARAGIFRWDDIPMYPKYLWSNRDFVLFAVEQNGLALQFADDSLKRDKEVVLAAIRQNAGAFEYADDLLRGDREFVLAVVRQDSYALKYADDSLKRDKEVVLAAIRQNAGAFEYADDLLRGDREFVLAAVSQDGWALEYADDSLKRDKDVLLAAVRQSYWVFKYIVDNSLRGDEEFILEAALVNINLLRIIEEGTKTTVWNAISKRLAEASRDRDLGIPRHGLKSFEAFRLYIEGTYGIGLLHLRSLDTVIDVLAARSGRLLQNDKRPLAIVIYPKADSNGTFLGYSTIDRLVELGYRTVYYKARMESDVEDALYEATAGGRRKADLIILSGHGTSETLSLSGVYLGIRGVMEDERFYIDVGDFGADGGDIHLDRYIWSDGDLILYSCSNGEGRDRNPGNLANTIGRLMPPGVKIHSSDMPANINDIRRGDDGRIEVEWSADSLYLLGGRGSEQWKR